MTRFFSKFGIKPLAESQRSMWRLIALAAVVGVVAGAGAVAFHYLTHAVVHYTLDAVAGYNAGGPAGEAAGLEGVFEPTGRTFNPWWLLLLPAAGGLVSGWIVYTFSPESEGHGTDAAIDAYHNKGGVIRPRVPIVKMITAAITIGTGGSGGREGPIAQIGAGFGSFVATKLGLSNRERRVLLAAGIGAGVGSIFHAPLAGAIFAIEVLYRDPDFEGDVLIPSFISTTIAYSVFGIVFGFQPLFNVAPLNFSDPVLLLPLAALAAAMTAASWFYVRCFYGLQGVFRRLRIPRKLRPMVGGAATGAVAVALYLAMAPLGSSAQTDVLSVLSFGYGFLQNILGGGITMYPGITTAFVVLLAVGLGKIVTTSLTIGSGGSGGVFGPSMVIGGALGGLVGLAFQQWMPNVVTNIEVFVILGMAGFFAAAANAPVSTLIMVSDMTGTYTLLLPSMWVCALAYLLGRGWSIYKEQVNSRIDSPAHRGDFVIDVLQGLTIRDAMKSDRPPLTTVQLGMRLEDVVRMIADTSQTVFPVVDNGGRLYGLFGVNDVRQFLYDTEAGRLAVAQDVTDTQTEPLRLDTRLGEAMDRFAKSPYDELPVTDPAAANRVVGTVRRQDIIAAYTKRLVEMRSEHKLS